MCFAQREAGSPTSEMDNIFAKFFKGIITLTTFKYEVRTAQ